MKWMGIEIETYDEKNYGTEQLKMSKKTFEKIYENFKAVYNFRGEAGKLTELTNAYYKFKSKYDCNIRFYKTLDGRELRRGIDNIVKAFGFRQIDDIKMLDRCPGVYIIELSNKYKQVYVGQSSHVGREIVEYFCDWVKISKTEVDYAHPHCNQIDATIKNGRERNGLGNIVDKHGRLPFGAFRPLDIVHIYYKPVYDELDRYTVEKNVIASFDEKFLCNISKGDEKNSHDFLPERKFELQDEKPVPKTNRTIFYGINVQAPDDIDPLYKEINRLVFTGGYEYISNIENYRLSVGVYILVFDKQDKVYIGIATKSIRNSIVETMKKLGNDKFNISRILVKEVENPLEEKKSIKIGRQYKINKK